jgi:hypothetical protein
MPTELPYKNGVKAKAISIKKFLSPDGNLDVTMFISPKIQKMNFVEYMALSVERQLILSTTLREQFIQLERPELLKNKELFDKVNFRMAVKELPQYFSKIPSISTCYLDLLEADLRKKDQIQLLKGAKISVGELDALVLYALSEKNYLYSFYSFHHCKGFDNELLPEWFEVTDEKVLRIGNTHYSDNQLRHYIRQRKVTVLKVLELKNEWHCFFYTYMGLKGEEQGAIGSHCHYASDKFNPQSSSFEEFLTGFRNGHYKVSSTPHIPIIDYGNQDRNDS